MLEGILGRGGEGRLWTVAFSNEVYMSVHELMINWT